MQLNNALLLLLGLFVLVMALSQSVEMMSFIVFVLFVLLLVERRARKQGEVKLRREYRGHKGR